MATAGRGPAVKLRCEQLTCHFGGVRALDGIDLETVPGERVAIVGPNGSGKSTFLNVISGALDPTAGRVILDGSAVCPHTPESFARAGVGRTFQDLRLFDELSIFDNVALGLSSRMWTVAGIPFASRRTVRRAVALALRHVALEVPAWRRVSELSYGQRKRVELARVLVWRPRLVLLDEPTAGLPRGELFDFGPIIDRVAGPQTTVVMVEHDLDLVAKASDRVLFMREGRIRADGPPREVLALPEVSAALGERGAV